MLKEKEGADFWTFNMVNQKISTSTRYYSSRKSLHYDEYASRKIKNAVNFYLIDIPICSGLQGFLLKVGKCKQITKSILEKNVLTHARHIFASTETNKVVSEVNCRL